MNKSTVEEIRERFDHDVERFSNLNTGQQTTIDAPLSLDLITRAAAAVVPNAKTMLDVGCGAGNYCVKLLDKLPELRCTMVDLSQPMLTRAKERVEAVSRYPANCVQGDIRKVPLPEEHFDIILAGAVLHHLRDDEDWKTTFSRLYRLLKPGGCLWISDMVSQESDSISQLVWSDYETYLIKLGGEAFCKHVNDYIRKEDSPRSVTEQLRLMTEVGFRQVELLHKNVCFAAYGGIK